MSAPNPLQDTHSSPPPLISAKTFHIAGILTTVYGLEEVPASSKSISCLWLLHPRLQTKQIMANVASDCINDWNQRRPADHKVGLIAVAFDQRNHGTREVNALANEAWRQGNKSHAQVSSLNMQTRAHKLMFFAGHVQVSCLLIGYIFDSDQCQYFPWYRSGYQPLDRSFGIVHLQRPRSTAY
jgi:hypothetical protein